MMQLEDSCSTSTSPFTPAVPSPLQMTPGSTENILSIFHILRTQSSHLHDDITEVNLSGLNDLLQCDAQHRIMEVGGSITADLFPDEAFGFPINDQFVKNFCNSFISPGKLFDTSNFRNEIEITKFLNQMVTTIADFLHSTKKTSLKPLRYFSSLQGTSPLLGAAKVEDCTLPHLLRRIPADSARLQRTQADSGGLKPWIVLV